MAQAMRVMQVVALCGSKAAILQGFSQNLDAHVALGRSKRLLHSSGAPSALRASSQLKDQQNSETLSVVAPATIASTLLVNASAANALTGEDVTGAFTKVSYFILLLWSVVIFSGCINLEKRRFGISAF